MFIAYVISVIAWFYVIFAELELLSLTASGQPCYLCDGQYTQCCIYYLLFIVFKHFLAAIPWLIQH